MNQQSFIHQYINDPRHVFQMNPNLFRRDDNEIIEYLKQLYLSIQRTMGLNAYFTIHVEEFRIIDDYDEVRTVLKSYQENAIKKSVKLRGTTENRYNFVDLKESDVKLLWIKFKTEAYDGSETFDTVIAVPRIINGQFIVLNGTVRIMEMQLVDASTYNNQTSNAKNPMVVFKTNFQPIRVYRNTFNISTINNEQLEGMTFDCDVFSKSLPACEYIFARMGLIRGLEFLGFDGVLRIHPQPPQFQSDLYYTFLIKKNPELYLSVPKELYNVNQVLQHIVYTIIVESSRKFMQYDNIFSNSAWLEALGRHFTLADPRKKATSVLSSFEMIYDEMTRSITRLRAEDMTDSYTILRWLLHEYNALILKSNLDVYSKRVRTSEYAAYLIAPRLSKAVYALSDMGERVNLLSIKKRIVLPYDYLLSEIGKQSIVIFNDTITDCDSFAAIKYSRNGPSAISEGNANASMPMVYRYLHPTSLGLLDDCASANSAPGIAGILCPLVQIYPGGYFNPNYKEPSEWRENWTALMNTYFKEIDQRQNIAFRNKILEDSNIEEMQIKDFQISEEERQRLLATVNR